MEYPLKRKERAEKPCISEQPLENNDPTRQQDDGEQDLHERKI
jgi:hypothetical protein